VVNEPERPQPILDGPDPLGGFFEVVHRLDEDGLTVSRATSPCILSDSAHNSPYVYGLDKQAITGIAEAVVGEHSYTLVKERLGDTATWLPAAAPRVKWRLQIACGVRHTKTTRCCA
jgi:hypothetical protein